MSRSPHDRRSNEAFWGVYELGVVAGTLPFVAIAAYESTIGKFNDAGVYEWQILVGPPLWAAACAFRLGAGRAAQIASSAG